MSQTSDRSQSAFRAWLTADRSFKLPPARVTLTWLAVAVGLLLRVLEYADNRQIYLDEKLLLDNLTNIPVWDLHTVLTKDQLAPPGFLIFERIMVRLPLPIIPTGRLLPFVAAMATMLYFPKVARRYIDRRAVPLATALFALGDYSLYYASELKQYSLEVALAVMALGLAPLAVDESQPDRRKSLATMALFGFVGVWFSFPLIFSLAGIGLVGLAKQVLRKDRRQATAWITIGLAWLLSFGGCFFVSDRIVAKGPFLRTWWDFAFLRIPPRSIEQAGEVFWQFVNVVIDPTGVVTPLDHVRTGLFCGGLILLGFAAMMQRSSTKAIILAAPFVFAAIAAAIKQYPFHGRLIQFLIPTVLFFLADGVAFISRRRWIGLGAGLVISAFLLAQPIGDVLQHRLIQRRARSFDSHGDLHNDLLDELEFKAKRLLSPFQSLPPS